MAKKIGKMTDHKGAENALGQQNATEDLARKTDTETLDGIELEARMREVQKQAF